LWISLSVGGHIATAENKTAVLNSFALDIPPGSRVDGSLNNEYCSIEITQA
jgi:hypothetical protein